MIDTLAGAPDAAAAGVVVAAVVGAVVGLAAAVACPPEVGVGAGVAAGAHATTANAIAAPVLTVNSFRWFTTNPPRVLYVAYRPTSVMALGRHRIKRFSSQVTNDSATM